MSLAYHVERNDIEEVKRLLKQNVNVDERGGGNKTALYWACERGYVEIAELLIQHGASINRRPIPLIAASRNGHEACVQLLLRHNANVHSTNVKGLSAMDGAREYMHFSIVELLLDHGASLPVNCDFISFLDARHSSLASKVMNKIFQRCQKCSDRLFSECLRCAFKLGLKDMAARVMSEDRSELQKHYAFAVYYCAKYNWPEILIQLLDKGANFNGTNADCESQTPLYCACEQGHKSIVEFLIKRGADVNECNDSRCKGYAYPLQIASVKGDVEIVRLLIENGASLDSASNARTVGSTKASMLPLHLAFDNGHMEVVELLVQRGSCIDSTDAEGNTVFLKAAQSCRLNKMRSLLSLGASVKCVNKKKETALHLVLADETAAAASDCASRRVTGLYNFLSRMYSPQWGNNSSNETSSRCDVTAKNEAKSEGEIADVVALLLERGVDCNSLCSDGETPLYRACNKQLDSVVKVLVEAKCEVNQTTAVKKHPILIACQKGCKKIVECLLAAGANVNIVPGNSSARPQFSYPRYAVLFSDSNGLTTPLCAATINCHKEIVDVLLAHGADVNLRDMSGKCAFDYSLDGLIQMSNDSRYGDHRAILRTLLESAKTLSCNFKIGDDNPLCRACAAGLYDVAEDLLGNEAFVECSSDVVMCDALAAACRKNDDRLVELLLKRGAKPNGVTSALQNALSHFQNSEDVKCTLLQEAADKGNDKMVAMLIQAGADVHQTDSCGNTALHAASNAAVALVLIHNGAVVNAVNKLQWTPLYAACDKEHYDVISTLLENGANPNQCKTAVPLIAACEKNSESIVTLLLEHGADPNCEVRTSDWRSIRPSVVHALCISCKKYNASIVGKLLSYGGRVSVVDSNGNSPLHLAISACCQTKLSSAGNRSTEVIDLLLSKSTSETLNIVNAGGETPLCLAVRNGLHDVTVKLLERGADVNASSSDKHPLVIACEASNVVYGTIIVYGQSETKLADRKKIIELLLMHKAKVNVETRDGRTPLFMAVENDQDDVVDLLLKYGAKPEPFLSSKKPQVDLHELFSSDITPGMFMRIVERESLQTVSLNVPLCLAAEKLNKRLIQLLVQHGGKVNTCNGDGNTPLHLAVSSHHESRMSDSSRNSKKIEVVTMLIELGASVHAVNSDGKTPLYLSCEQDIKLTELLLTKGADPNTRPISSENSNGRYSRHFSTSSATTYPLSYAVSRRNIDLIELLLEHGAGLDNTEANGKTALHLATESTPNLGPSAFRSHYQQSGESIVELLLRRGATVNVTDDTGETALYKACKKNNIQIATAVLQRGADPNLKTTDKYPLIAACENDNVELVKLLLTSGAAATVLPREKTMHSDNRQLPLHIAAAKRNFQMIDVLIEHGADVNQQDKDGKTALHIVADRSDSQSQTCIDMLLQKKADINVLSTDKETPLYLACNRGATNTIEKMLASCPVVCHPNAKQPLAAAVRSCNLQLVKLLSQHGADVNALSLTDGYGSTALELPLSIAAGNGQVDVVKYLLERNATVNRTDSKFHSPLFYVVEKMRDFAEESSSQNDTHQIIFDMLLERGADVNMTGSGGETALCKAVIRGLKNVVRRLLKQNGNPNVAFGKDYPLGIACRRSDKETVNVLLDGGADPNLFVGDPQSSSPLFIAAKNLCSSSSIVDALLASGVRIDNHLPADTDAACQNQLSDPLTLNSLIIPFTDEQEYIIKLFKAGAGLQLLFFCCDNERRLKPVAFPLSNRLCQAVLLAGHRLQLSDSLRPLMGHQNHCCQQLLSWLEEDTKKPPSLIRQSRIAVRRQLSLASRYRSILPLIDQLPIPRQLQLYVKFEGLLSEVDLTVCDAMTEAECVTTHGFDDDDDDDDDDGDDDDDHFVYEDYDYGFSWHGSDRSDDSYYESRYCGFWLNNSDYEDIY